jgi:5-formyltetrahydrofolate cyclo-ligase
MDTSEKNNIRRMIKEQRKVLEAAEKSAWDGAICRQLLNLDDIRRAFCIYCYVSFHREVSTWRFMESLLRDGKCVAVPRVAGKKLEFYAISGKADLEESAMGIMEPKQSCLRVNDLEAPVIVPGLAFDKSGNRMGYGGGYYDRLFEKEPNHPRIAIAYGFQIFDQIPTEPHDKRMDRIIIP